MLFHRGEAAFDMYLVLEGKVRLDFGVDGSSPLNGTYGPGALVGYSAVCATGLDTVPLPGDVSVEQIERVFADIASLAFKWNKPLAGRILPVKGKKAGDQTDFHDPYLFNTVLRSLP